MKFTSSGNLVRIYEGANTKDLRNPSWLYDFIEQKEQQYGRGRLCRLPEFRVAWLADKMEDSEVNERRIQRKKI